MNSLRIQTRRWGSILAPEAQVITFDQGWVGYPALRRFVPLDVGASGPLGWLQNLEQPPLGVPVSVPELFGARTQDLLAAAPQWCEAGDDTIVLVIATVRGGAPVTGNLQAPLLVDRVTRRGHQVVLDRPDLPMRAEIVAEGAVWHRALPVPTLRVRCPRVSV